MMQRTWLLVGLCVLVAILTYSHMFDRMTLPNERSRLYLTLALIDDHSFAIDGPRARFGPVLDEASHGGHAYTDKAPGSSLLAAIPYALLRCFVRAEELTLPVLLRLARYGVVLPIALGGLWAFLRLGRRLSIPDPAVIIAALGWMLGTAAFHYSTAFYGHQIVAVALLLCWLSSDAASRSGDPGIRCKHSAVAGGLAGVAVLTEYQAGLAIPLIWLALVWSGRHRATKGLVFLAALCPCLLFLGYYQASCFGGPFEIGYHHLSNPALARIHGQGIAGVVAPELATLGSALFSLHKGLLVTSPFLALSFWGAHSLVRRGEARTALVLSGLVLLFLIFVASAKTWDAGWGYGPRLLIPILPFLACLSAEGIHRTSVHWLPRGLGRGVVVVGILGYQGMRAFFPEPPNELSNPWLDVVEPLIRHDLVAPNWLMSLFDIRGIGSLAPLVVLVSMPVIWILLSQTPRRLCVRQLLVGLLPVALWSWLIVEQGPTATFDQREQLVQLVRKLTLPAPQKRTTAIRVEGGGHSNRRGGVLGSRREAEGSRIPPQG